MSKHHQKIGWRIAAWETGYRCGVQRRAIDPQVVALHQARGLRLVLQAAYLHGLSIKAQLEQQTLRDVLRAGHDA